jgi:hypothetical protein
MDLRELVKFKDDLLGRIINQNARHASFQSLSSFTSISKTSALANRKSVKRNSP